MNVTANALATMFQYHFITSKIEVDYVIVIRGHLIHEKFDYKSYTKIFFNGKMPENV